MTDMPLAGNSAANREALSRLAERLQTAIQYPAFANKEQYIRVSPSLTGQPGQPHSITLELFWPYTMDTREITNAVRGALGSTGFRLYSHRDGENLELVGYDLAEMGKMVEAFEAHMASNPDSLEVMRNAYLRGAASVLEGLVSIPSAEQRQLFGFQRDIRSCIDDWVAQERQHPSPAQKRAHALLTELETNAPILGPYIASARAAGKELSR